MDCTIRKWKMTDAADLAAAVNHLEILNNLRDGLPYPYTVADAEAYIASVLSDAQDGTYAFAIAVEGRAIGSISVHRQTNIHFRTAEIGYYLARQYWGRGLGTSAVEQACAWIFAHTDILRIYAEPFARNIASCRVLEKAGFVCEGILRKNAVKNGRVLDMKMYALVRESE